MDEIHIHGRVAGILTTIVTADGAAMRCIWLELKGRPWPQYVRVGAFGGLGDNLTNVYGREGKLLEVSGYFYSPEPGAHPVVCATSIDEIIP